jgi:diguanylate cyclase (GGDEF)-like protein
LQVNIAVSVLLSGGARSALLPLMVVPVFTQAVCFRPRVTLAWVSTSGLLAVAAVLGADRLAAVPAPPRLLSVVSHLALLGCLALAAHYLAAADVTSRDAAVLDPLTGLFNRKALTADFAQARARALLQGGEVGMVMCDLDHFKAVNDTHGHDRGDLVLIELAVQLRLCVRESDLIYRLGGEEFLVLLPGHDAAGAAAVAERVRAHVAARPLAGVALRISAGVTSACGEAVDLTRMAKEADQALYEAKSAGRDRVRTSGDPRAPAGQAP